MLFPSHLFPFVIQSQLISLLAYALFLFLFSSFTWVSFALGEGVFFLVFILPEHNSAITVAVAYSTSLYFVKSRQLSQITDPIARFPNSIWAFTFFFMFILLKGSLSFIFVSYITRLFSILCLMLSISSFCNFCSKNFITIVISYGIFIYLPNSFFFSK